MFIYMYTYINDISMLYMYNYIDDISYVPLFIADIV